MDQSQKKSVKVGSVLMSQEKKDERGKVIKESKPYIKVENDIMLKAGDTISILPPKRSKYNKETGQFDELPVPEFVKNDLVKFNN